MKTETRHHVASAAFGCVQCGARLDAEHVDVAADGSHCTFCGATQQDRPPTEVVSLDVGDALHDARVHRGETLEQAAHFTRIQIPYLRALEHDDASVFDPFPGMTYARYFLRDYAEHLGIDPGPLVRRFDSEVAAPPVLPTVSPPSTRQPRPGRWAFGAAVVLVALVVASAAWSRGYLRQDVARGTTTVTSPAAAPDVSGPSLDPARTPPPAHRMLVMMRTRGRPSWIQATVDGTVVREETVPADTTLRFHATHTFEIRLGDAGAVLLTVNGKSVSTGGAGAVADLSFALRDGRVVRF
jgi:cytoskeletal protein RodZ